MGALWCVIPAEWLGLRKLRAVLMKILMPLAALGIILATLHQASLGALYVMMPSKIHPLWYSSWLPAYFFISCLYAGLSMVILEGTLSHAGLHAHMDEHHIRSFDGICLSLARGAALIMGGYLVIRVAGLTLDNGWPHVFSGYGALWLLELVLVIVPMLLYAAGARERRFGLIRLASGLAVLGIALNRFNVSMVAFNYNLPSQLRYFPSLGEFAVSLFLVAGMVALYRFVCAKMPILRDHPDYRREA
jgi:Ni/Fe-hydrogenase subunit HybB-like protein